MLKMTKTLTKIKIKIENIEIQLMQANSKY